MAVALDVAGTGLQFGATLGSTGVSYTGITVGSGANRALTLGLFFDNATDVSPVAVWDSGASNQTMGSITSLTCVGGRFIYLIGLVAPTSGNKTLKITWTGTISGYANAIAWTGANQTGGTTTFNNPQTASSGAVSPIAITTTGTASDASVAAVACDSGVHRTVTTGTSWWADSTGPGGNVYGDYKLGVGSISDTIDGTKNAAMVGCTIVAAASSTFTYFPMTQPDMAFLLRKAEMVGY